MHFVPDVTGERVIIPRNFQPTVTKRIPHSNFNINFKKRGNPLFAQQPTEEPKPVKSPEYIQDQTSTSAGYKNVVRKDNIFNTPVTRNPGLSLVPNISF
jgi:hypothetical protein